jgi:hypothetical protein
MLALTKTVFSGPDQRVTPLNQAMSVTQHGDSLPVTRFYREVAPQCDSVIVQLYIFSD